MRYYVPRPSRRLDALAHDEWMPPTVDDEVAAIDRFVTAFSAELRDKLIAKAREGRTGWDSEDWSVLDIIAALVSHIPKNDPIDVAAFAAFWWNRQEPK